MANVDEELAIVVKRRTQALDLLVRTFMEICNCDYRLDVLLERRTAQQIEPDRMT